MRNQIKLLLIILLLNFIYLGNCLKCYKCGGIAPNEPECPSSDYENNLLHKFLTECDGMCHNETNSGNGKLKRYCLMGDNEIGCNIAKLPMGGGSIGINRNFKCYQFIRIPNYS